jgi:hypothetical protein
MHTGSIMRPDQLDEDSRVWALDKSHEDLAQMVENRLRDIFARTNIWVIPTNSVSQTSPQVVRQPAIRLIDGFEIKMPIDMDESAVVLKAKEICSEFYGQEKVYVSTEDATIMPEGDGLKYAVDQLLKLRYGHMDYTVEFERKGNSNHVEIYITDWDSVWPCEDGDEDDYEEGLPQDVVTFVKKVSQELRPGIVFEFAQGIVYSPEQAPYFAPGFEPV